MLNQLIWLSLKTKDIFLKTKDSLLKTEDGLLKTEDILLETKESPSVNQKLLPHILTNVSTYLPTHTQASDLDDYNNPIEIVILNHFWEHFRINRLIPNYKCAYIANYSTETPILNIFNNILQNMENNTNTTMVALDPSATFNTVNHKIL